MRTTYYVAASLDGFIADDHDSVDWLEGHHGEESSRHGYGAFVSEIGALVMGARSYEWLQARVASGADTWPYDLPAWVLTHHELPGVTGADVRFASGDPEPVHAAMVAAADGRDLWVMGGGTVAADFASAGLLDRMIVTVAPVTLGSGRPLLPRPIDLRLVDVERSGDFVCVEYDVLGRRTASG